MLIFVAEGLTKRSAVGLLLRSLIMVQTFISRYNANLFSDKLVLTSVTPASSAPVVQTPKATSSTLFFVFQAEDGIRDLTVTGVQTCALPICLLVQLAAARGARVIATASAKKAERIRGYGASEVLDYHGDWPALVREITGGGAPKAVNAARGQAATALKAVADRRRLATITGDPPRGGRGVALSHAYVPPD